MAKVELVLLDDCLAAVDVHVARAICEEALLGILLDGERTRCRGCFPGSQGSKPVLAAYQYSWILKGSK